MNKPTVTYCQIVVPKLTTLETVVNAKRDFLSINSLSVYFYHLNVPEPYRMISVPNATMGFT